MKNEKKQYRIEWYFGNICNYAKCSYCFNKDSYSQYWRNMNKEETDKVIDFINNLPSVSEIAYLGGEPSTFKYFFYSLDKIKHNFRIHIMSNALDVDFIEKCLAYGTKEKPVFICISPHYEIYLADKKNTLKRFEKIMNLGKKYQYSTIEFNILLDGEKTKEYQDMIEFLYYQGKKNNLIKWNTSYVYRTGDTKEAIKNLIVLDIFDDELKQFLKNDIMRERMNSFKPNEFFNKKCPAYEHFLYIRLDGKIDGLPSCPQNCITTKSIFDDDFDLEEEKLMQPICKYKHKMNWGICEIAHGMQQRF